MPARIEVTCIKQSGRFAADQRISKIGGTNFAGRRWTMSQEGAIHGIETGKHVFYVSTRGRITNVAVATSASGKKYLTAIAEHEHSDSLLGLPSCPD